ncbi:MAG: hypothetical protein EBS89_09455 [Proteobacteria bacterium]|nr:hypothetical protein [Pseudomonadota bacterium]
MVGSVRASIVCQRSASSRHADVDAALRRTVRHAHDRAPKAGCWVAPVCATHASSRTQITPCVLPQHGASRQTCADCPTVGLPGGLMCHVPAVRGLNAT